MKNKEKEKLWLKKVKELSKTDGWKFKRSFTFKTIDELYFSSSFYVSMRDSTISGWLGYKTLNIDNIFWDIIDEQGNKTMPLSFRSEAAFCVRNLNYFDYKIKIQDELNLESEIIDLLKSINEKVLEKASAIKSIIDFRNDLLKDEKRNCVGILTTFIEQKQFENALTKIKYYRERGINSGFGFGNKDFFDLTEEYIIKNHK